MTQSIFFLILVHRNEIALLKLEKRTTIRDEVQLACLPQHDATLTHNQSCYITGWGRLYSKTHCYCQVWHIFVKF